MVDDEIVVVCARLTTPLYIADNVIGKCDECGAAIQFRPHAPKGKRLCIGCVNAMVADGEKVTVATTPRMVEDFLTYLKKKMH